MNDTRPMGYLHHDDGTFSIVGQDGFCWEPGDPEIKGAPVPAALEVPTIDVAPESVTDVEAGREIED